MQEEPDLSIGWSCIDDIVANLTTALDQEGMAVRDVQALEAQSHATLGLLWERVLLNREIGVAYYRCGPDSVYHMDSTPPREARVLLSREVGVAHGRCTERTHTTGAFLTLVYHIDHTAG